MVGWIEIKSHTSPRLKLVLEKLGDLETFVAGVSNLYTQHYMCLKIKKFPHSAFGIHFNLFAIPNCLTVAQIILVGTLNNKLTLTVVAEV